MTRNELTSIRTVLTLHLLPIEAYLLLVDGVVAQLVERLVRNEKVAGSIPVGSTIQTVPASPKQLRIVSAHPFLYTDFMNCRHKSLRFPGAASPKVVSKESCSRILSNLSRP